MAKSRSGKQIKVPFAVEKPVDLRDLEWWEIRQELEKSNSKISKLALLRQLAENFWRGRYRNSVKNEVERYLCGFLNGQSQANMSILFGCGFMDKSARQKAVRQVKLIIFAFLSRSKVDGATQGLIDAVRKQPPDGNFLRDADFAIKASRL